MSLLVLQVTWHGYIITFELLQRGIKQYQIDQTRGSELLLKTIGLRFRELSLDVRLAAPQIVNLALRCPRCCANLRSACSVSWPLQGAIWGPRHLWYHRWWEDEDHWRSIYIFYDLFRSIQLFWIESRDTRILGHAFLDRGVHLDKEQVHVTESAILSEKDLRSLGPLIKEGETPAFWNSTKIRTPTPFLTSWTLTQTRPRVLRIMCHSLDRLFQAQGRKSFWFGAVAGNAQGPVVTWGVPQ